MTNTRLIAGGLLAAVPLVLVAGFTGLQITFEYPDILRHPAGDVLTKFAAGRADLHAYWYMMFAAGIALLPAAIGLTIIYWKANPFGAAMIGTFGVLAGLVQSLGLLRWTVLVPRLAANYTAPGASELDKALAASAFDSANAYLGMGVGEHMGYLFTALFTLSVTIVIARQWPVMAWVGVAFATGIAAGMLEVLGVRGVSSINAIAFMGWSVWAVALGVLILRGRSEGIAGIPQTAQAG